MRLAYNLRCESHPDAALIEDYRAGDVICSECAIVVGERMIDVEAEWRSFADDEGIDRSRVGQAEDPLAKGQVQSTRIGAVPGVGKRGQPTYVNRSVETAAEKKSRLVREEIKEMAERLSLDYSVITRAQDIYLIAQQEKLAARKCNALLAACLFVACRQEDVPRTFKEICAVSNAQKKTVAKYYQTIRTSAQVIAQNASVNTSSTDLLARYCSFLNLPKATQNLAERVAANAMKLDIMMGRSPITIAAAAIMIAANMTQNPRTSLEIKEACGAAESTIKLVHNLLMPRINTLVPPQYQREPEPVKPVKRPAKDDHQVSIKRHAKDDAEPVKRLTKARSGKF